MPFSALLDHLLYPPGPRAYPATYFKTILLQFILKETKDIKWYNV